MSRGKELIVSVKIYTNKESSLQMSKRGVCIQTAVCIQEEAVRYIWGIWENFIKKRAFELGL